MIYLEDYLLSTTAVEAQSCRCQPTDKGYAAWMAGSTACAVPECQRLRVIERSKASRAKNDQFMMPALAPVAFPVGVREGLARLNVAEQGLSPEASNPFKFKVSHGRKKEGEI